MVLLNPQNWRVDRSGRLHTEAGRFASASERADYLAWFSSQDELPFRLDKRGKLRDARGRYARALPEARREVERREFISRPLSDLDENFLDRLRRWHERRGLAFDRADWLPLDEKAALIIERKKYVEAMSRDSAGRRRRYERLLSYPDIKFATRRELARHLMEPRYDAEEGVTSYRFVTVNQTMNAEEWARVKDAMRGQNESDYIGPPRRKRKKRPLRVRP